MKYQLIKPINPDYSALEQVLTNRGVEHEELNHYIHTTDDDINSPLLLGEDNLARAAAALTSCILSRSKAALIIDPDVDGFSSSALFINYLRNFCPTWVDNCLDRYMHSGKQHGLDDLCDELLYKDYKLVIVLDAGSGDYECHKKLADQGIQVIIADHHPVPEISSYAIVINNQLCDYPNKFLSGVGVTWELCRYIDSLLGEHYADQYLDLVALGLSADMMPLLSIETKHLINKGFQPENIHNPFIYNLWQKNQFKLGDHITSWGADFYIVPFANAVIRSGTQEEKEVVFESMLEKEAYQKIPSTKRGHKPGEEETVVEQAMRVCTNVKNRQTRAQDESMEFLEEKIQDEHLMDNKVLLLLLEPGQISPNIAGLLANRFMGKYQRPCCILTKVEAEGTYQGSARGCEAVGIKDFKQICADTGLVTYVAGHPNAFGLGLRPQDVPEFIEKTNAALKDMQSEPIYYVDYIYNGVNVNPENILDIANMDEYWGQGVQPSLIAIHGLKVTKDMVTLMSPDKSPTLKITLPNGTSIIKFKSGQEEYEKFDTEGYVEVDIVGECNANEWNGNVTPQVFITDYEVVDSCKYYF